MDIKCPRCGEPWSIDCLHDEVSARYRTKPWILNDRGVHDLSEDGKHNQPEYEKYFSIVQKDFRMRGCIALSEYTDIPCTPNPRAEIYGALMDFAGDDIDFAASMIEDAERFGL